MMRRVRSDSARPIPDATTVPFVVRHDARFFLLHAWLPLAVFVALVVVTMGMGGDTWLADRLYAWEGHRWQLRDAFLTDALIHGIGRDLSALAWVGVLIAWLVARSRERWARWAKPLAYLWIATGVAAVSVAWLKSWSNMDCPWDLVRYGGQRPYVGLFDLRPLHLSRGACFPAGHASGGYAWLSLYFFLWTVRPRWRWLGLALGIAVGLVFGIGQQLRGAHFLSHDVWTLAICWTAVLSLHLAFWHRSDDAPRALVSHSFVAVR